MKNIMNRKFLLAFSVAASLFGGLILWYQPGLEDPLTGLQIQDYLSRIGAQSQAPGGRHNLEDLKKLMEKDDGKPIYTVNLYQFREVADYPENSGYEGTGSEAYERFSKLVVPLMLERGSHPIFGSSWNDASSNWDRVVVVRYRSRKDLMDMFATDAFADASLHKWASIEKHTRMVVQATHIPGGQFIFLIIALFGFALTYWASGRFQK